MKYDWLDHYLLSLSGAEKDYKPEWAWFRYMIRGKLFAAVCSPSGMKDEAYNGHDLVNLKCDPRPERDSPGRPPRDSAGVLLRQADLDRLPPGRGAAGRCAPGAVRPVPRAGLRKLPKYVQREILGE